MPKTLPKVSMDVSELLRVHDSSFEPKACNFGVLEILFQALFTAESPK